MVLCIGFRVSVFLLSGFVSIGFWEQGAERAHSLAARVFFLKKPLSYKVFFGAPKGVPIGGILKDPECRVVVVLVHVLLLVLLLVILVSSSRVVE